MMIASSATAGGAEVATQSSAASLEVGFSWVGGGIVFNQGGDVADTLYQVRTTLLAQSSDHDFTLSAFADRDFDLNQFMVGERSIHLFQYRRRQAFTGDRDNRAE